MKLHCFGTTGYHPSPTRQTACYYLPDLQLVLDAGTGVFRLIEHLYAHPQESITILLSHAHLDHVVGLTFLLDAQAVTPLKHIRVIGEGQKLAALRKHLYHELLFPVQPDMEFVELESSANSTLVPGCDLDWFPLEHPGGSVGYCLSAQGKKLAYVTDTVAREDAEYIAKIKDADLLLHECYFKESTELAEKSGHSWLSAVCKVVQAAGPTQTALIHVNPLAEMLDQQLTLDADMARELNMSVARDGMIFEF